MKKFFLGCIIFVVTTAHATIPSIYLNKPLPEENIVDSSINLKMLREAWRDVTNVRIVVNGEIFDNFQTPGNGRPFMLRWNLVKDHLSMKNKKILDLGSTIGMAGIYALKYQGARSCTAVDYDVERLKTGNNIDTIFGVNVDRFPLDFNTSSYEKVIGSDFDVVICTSILHWIKDKKRFLNYLSSFPAIIFEGNDPNDIEIKRFAEVGFLNYRILGVTDLNFWDPRRRTLILFYK